MPAEWGPWIQPATFEVDYALNPGLVRRRSQVTYSDHFGTPSLATQLDSATLIAEAGGSANYGTGVYQADRDVVFAGYEVGATYNFHMVQLDTSTATYGATVDPDPEDVPEGGYWEFESAYGSLALWQWEIQFRATSPSFPSFTPPAPTYAGYSHTAISTTIGAAAPTRTTWRGWARAGTTETSVAGATTRATLLSATPFTAVCYTEQIGEANIPTLSSPGSYTERSQLMGITAVAQYTPPRYRIWYPDGLPSTAVGMWTTRQRQTLTGNAGGWATRQRGTGSANGGWPLRHRQTGI